MGKDWIEYQCNSGQTLFVYNKVTGEHKWPHGLGQEGIEYRIMHGRLVDYKEYRTAATQTDDNGCSNGCMSMYINKDISDGTSCLPDQRSGVSNENGLFGPKTYTIKEEQKNKHEEGQSMGMVTANQNNLAENSSDDDDDNAHDYSDKRRDTDDQDHNQKLYNISEMLSDLKQRKCSLKSKFMVDRSAYDKHNGDNDDDGDDDSVGNDCDNRSNCDFDNEGEVCVDNDVNCDDYDGHSIDGHVSSCDNYDDTIDVMDNDDKGNSVYDNIEDNNDNLGGDDSKDEDGSDNVNDNGICKNLEQGVDNQEKHKNSKEIVQVISVPTEAEFPSEVDMADGIKQEHDDDTDEHGFNKKRQCNANTQQSHKCSGSKKNVKSGRKPHDRDVHFILNIKDKDMGPSKLINIYTKEKLFECSFCKKKFGWKGNLNRHVMTHTNEKCLECTVCKKKLSNKGSLENHLMIHSNEKPFTCSICNKTFRYKCNFKTHIRVHSGLKPFECSYCKKKFSRTDTLNTHVRLHTGEKLSLECPLCKKVFNYKCSLNRHVRSHTNSEPTESE